jgi:23S rRNA (uracil1939-C5)-methyltransferase
VTGQPETLLVESLGTQGEGLARRPDGSLVPVPQALPGETVVLRREGGASVLVAIEHPSPQRVAPPCPHFAAGCGGCVLQHWDLSAQQAWKHGRLAAALARAGFADPAVAETIATPLASRRRVDLAARRLPTGEVIVGLHKRGAGTVLDVLTCAVLHPGITALLAPMRLLLRSLPALSREASVVVNLLDSGPDLLLRVDRRFDATDRRLVAAFAERHGLPRVSWALRDGTTEVAAQTGPVALALAGTEVAPPPGAFLQASAAGEAAIVGAVLAALPARLRARPRILDLYAGIGTLSFPLAARAHVTAAEGEAEAVLALQAAARRGGARVEALRRDLARQPFLPAALAPFDVVVLDPPYAGAAEQVAQIARSTARHVVYVSCNPAALARDAALLRTAGFRLLSAVPVDQFVWSAHVEAVVALAR